MGTPGGHAGPREVEAALGRARALGPASQKEPKYFESPLEITHRAFKIVKKKALAMKTKMEFHTEWAMPEPADDRNYSANEPEKKPQNQVQTLAAGSQELQEKRLVTKA